MGVDLRLVASGVALGLAGVSALGAGAAATLEGCSINSAIGADIARGIAHGISLASNEDSTLRTSRSADVKLASREAGWMRPEAHPSFKPAPCLP